MSDQGPTTRDKAISTAKTVAADYARLLTVKGLVPTEIQLDSKGTLVGPTPRPLLEPGEAARLPELLDAAGPHLELGAVLGAGGMGVVRSAVQAGLEREVAVKMVHTEANMAAGVTTAMAGALLREARIAGAIAHPNVVPVHLLGRDAAGRPVMVMKRVDGQSWQDVLDSESLQPGDPGLLADGRLERHLRILIQVGHATDHAHARGILHRDLKPDNVLLGSFGEIYVVDWGIAIAVPGAPSVSGIPVAEDSDMVCGTPAYMSPELATGRGSQQGPATDVYLLGAVLYHLIAGAPPHVDETPYKMMLKAYQSEPPRFEPDVPQELAAICTRAMAADPGDRYSSVGALNDALQGYLFTRDAIRLRDEALERLGQLRKLLASAETGEAFNSRLFRTYSECRFAFSQAQRALPDDERIIEGMQAAVDLMVTRALSFDNFVVAEALLGDAPSPDPAHVAKTRKLRIEAGRRQARLDELERRADPTVGDSLRSAQTLGVGIAWLLAHLAMGHLHRSGEAGVVGWTYGCVLAGFLVLIAGLAFQNRELALRHTTNRIFVAMCLCQIAVFLGMWPLMLYLGLGLDEAYALAGVPVSLISLFGAAAALQWPLVLPGTLIVLVIPSVLMWPRWTFEIGGLASGTALLAMGWFWRTRARALSDRERPRGQ